MPYAGQETPRGAIPKRWNAFTTLAGNALRLESRQPLESFSRLDGILDSGSADAGSSVSTRQKCRGLEVPSLDV
jgi:hypothetical protein